MVGGLLVGIILPQRDTGISTILKNHTMTPNIHSEPPRIQLSATARELARRASESAKDAVARANVTTKNFTEVVQDAAMGLTDVSQDVAKHAKDLSRSVARKAKLTLASSQQYAHRNPVPVLLGTIALGAVIAYMVSTARRAPLLN